MDETLHYTGQMGIYMRDVWVYMEENPAQRYGQALFNVLYMDYQELSDEVLHSELDTFYTVDGDKINMFLLWLDGKFSG